MRIGLDIGSTTIKCVVLDDANNILYSCYERHFSHIVSKSKEILHKIENTFLHGEKAVIAISGSAGMGLSQNCDVEFVQEVYAEKVATSIYHPETDCIIELGGEDAKILFLTNGVEVRMNGSCAGGTGAFIDQMAALLKMSAEEMNIAALQADHTYTIASRCGVFAKTDVQPLINQGAKPSNIAASIYQAVVNQTIAGLSQGRTIKGNVLYLGGPLTFATCLRNTFDATLHLHGVCPDNSLYYVALGAALYANKEVNLSEVCKKIDVYDSVSTYASLPPLFENREQYWKFHNRHAKAHVPVVPFNETCGPVHIGIDSGSTTIKIVVINTRGELLYKRYEPNDGNPLPVVKETLIALYRQHPHLHILSVTTTGYGEALMKKAFHCDYGVVETVAHFTAAKHFMPDVDFIIDIGGQDMKCFKIENNAISDIFLNEACSSGCGSFLQTFAQAMGYSVEEFAMQGLFARHPVDLGSRCTVFMNSSVKQAQKDGAQLDCISAGLSLSVVKNALYKVIRVYSPEQLGKHIVVQGGTFYNEAVLRAFEQEMGVNVVRPDIAGLMGAYGAALYGASKSAVSSTSGVLPLKELLSFSMKNQSITCQGCGNHCSLTINTFSDGERLVSGNKCEKPVTGKASDDSLNLYAYKMQSLLEYANTKTEGTRGKIGIPLVLNMYELLPFWHAFFTSLGFQVVVSPVSSHKLYQDGQNTIPSDTACYPAKMTHGHIAWLCSQEDVHTIFYPCMTYNFDEHLGDNHYNCPVVAYYPEVLANNIPDLKKKDFFYEYINLSDEKEFRKHFPGVFRKHFPSVSYKEIDNAITDGYAEYKSHMEAIRRKGKEIIQKARQCHKQIIVLAGRPYHVDPEINHGIDKLIIRQNAAIITEDSISDILPKFETSVLNQWTYHSRLYAAAKYCTTQKDMNLIQLVSFGCGLDAITTDETREILQAKGKLYTQLKIDEVTNLGAVNIRIRSLFAALEEQQEEESQS